MIFLVSGSIRLSGILLSGKTERVKPLPPVPGTVVAGSKMRISEGLAPPVKVCEKSPDFCRRVGTVAVGWLTP